MSLPPVFTVLAASPDVTAIIGTDPVRCYPAGNIPQVSGTDPNATLPCVTWQSIGGTPENMLADAAVVDNLRVQLDCWTTGFGASQALADAVRAALESSGYLVSFNPDSYESETKRYSVSFDWSFWLNR